MNAYDKYPVSLTNSLSGKKETFVPLHKEYVGIYVCGPTVYSDVHLGNVRTFMAFDVIVRYLRYLGYKVRYVRNITDVGHLESDADEGEDKIARKAHQQKIEPMEVVMKYTEDFHQVMQAFNNLPPSIEPSATGHIIEQIETIKSLIDKGYAYEVNGSVYFDVLKYNDQYQYGILSRRVLEDLMESGRALDNQDEKRNKLDFALWKKASPSHIMRWPSPWSEGFPGWHLECSVMSTKYLGTPFDIHGGGMDLKFPHHDCEIAQTTGVTGKPPVNYWVHANMLTVNGQKMSKSLGNSFLPRELFAGNHPLLDRGYGPMPVRLFMLQSHYTSTLDFSNEAMAAAEKGYRKLMGALEIMKKLEHPGNDKPDPETEKTLIQLVADCYTNMSDDFNTAKTLAVLFEMASRVNDMKSGNLDLHTISPETFNTFKSAFTGFIEEVLGLQAEATSNDALVDELVQLLIRQRKKAREEKNFALSDRIRDDLKAIGVQLKDGKGGEMTYQIADP